MKHYCLNFFHFVLIHIMMLLCISCSESTPEPSISGGAETIEVGSQACMETISFSTNSDWFAKVDASWVKLSQTKGTPGDFMLTLTVESNKTYEPRMATITIVAGSASAQYVVTQSEGKGFIISTTEFNIGSTGGSLVIPIKANVGYSCEVDEACSSWLSIAEGRTMSSYQMVITVKENTSYDERIGKVYVAYGDEKTTITITQSQLSELILEKKEFEIDSKGGEIKVSVQSNVQYTCEVMGEAANWISIIQPSSRGLEKSDIVLSVKENVGDEGRIGQIKVNGANKESVITITQYQKDDIRLEKTSYEINEDGGYISIPVQSNVPYDVAVEGEAQNWIHLIKSRALDKSEIELYVGNNPTYEERMGIVVVTAGEKRQEVTITQSQKNAILLEKSSFEISYRSTHLEVPLKSNVEFSVIIPEKDKNWVSVTGTRALESHTINLSIGENKSVEQRVSEILVQSGEVKETLYIVQAGMPAPEMVDMGLSVKWASFNLGATKEEDAGRYFAWGEMEGYFKDEYHNFNWGDYLVKFGSTMWSSSDAGTNSDPLKEYVYPNRKDLGFENDAAHQMLGSNWRMPSEAELQELITNSTVESATINGVEGCYFTSKINQNKLFFPASGYGNGSALEYALDVYVWTATPGANEPYYANCMNGASSGYNLGRCIGLPIRPVYGLVKSVPSVSMFDVRVESNTITFRGHVDNAGGAAIVKKGFLYSTSQNPTSSNAINVECNSADFTSQVSGLSPKTTYYVKSYAQNMVGTAYSEVKSFVTNDVAYTEIASERDLLDFAARVRSSDKPLYAELVADVRLTRSWTPMGTANKPFKGVFNGNHHQVSNLNCSQDYSGLFGVTSDAVIKNLAVSGKLQTGSAMGAVVGKAYSTTIDHCVSSVEIVSGENIGGIVGDAEDCIISNCDHLDYVVGNTSSSNAGGIVGITLRTQVFNCSNKGNLFGSSSYGGIVGYQGVGGSVTNCYNKGSFKRMYFVDMAGGIVGYNCGSITNSYSSGTMSAQTISGDMGRKFCGGVVGYNHTDSSCFCCYFLKQFPINDQIDYVGMLNWGSCSKCGSFNGSGEFENTSLSYTGATEYLRVSLNSWVDSNNAEGKYKRWETNSGWPGFAE